MDEYKLFVQRIGLVGITNILISLSSLILVPVLSKNLSIQDYGVWSLFIATVAFIPLLANLGLPYSMLRFLAVEHDTNIIREEFYSISFILLVMGLITSLALLILSKQISLLLFNGSTTISIILAATVFVTVMISSFFTYFRTYQQMKVFSVLYLIQTYLMVLLVVIFIQWGYEIKGVLFGYFLAQIVVVIAAFIFIIRQIGFVFPKFKNIREYLSFGIPTVPSNLSTYIVDLSDRYVIGILLGTAYVGYYSPGYTLGNIITMFMAPFTFLLPSLLSSYYDQNKLEDVNLHLQYSLKYFLLVAIPAIFGLSLLSKPLLTLLSTAEIAQNGYFITPFVALSACLVGIYGIISQILALKKKTKIIGTMWIIAAVLNVVLNIILVPIYGIIAAAITTLTAYAFTCVAAIFYSNKYIKVHFDLKFILKSVFASIIMSSIIIYIKPVSVILILITIFICSLVYIGVIILLKGISMKEFEFFKKLLRS